MAEIKFSLEAIDDLQQIKVYITDELCNEQAANSTIARIMKNINRLKAFSNSGAPLNSIIEFDTNYRFLVCGNYTTFYRIENDTVLIVRVLYSRRDFMRILFESKKITEEL